jgi:hypothetical protein
MGALYFMDGTKIGGGDGGAETPEGSVEWALKVAQQFTSENTEALIIVRIPKPYPRDTFATPMNIVVTRNDPLRMLGMFDWAAQQIRKLIGIAMGGQ